MYSYDGEAESSVSHDPSEIILICYYKVSHLIIICKTKDNSRRGFISFVRYHVLCYINLVNLHCFILAVSIYKI